MPEVELEEVATDMARFISNNGLQMQFENWMLSQGHDQETVDAYNQVIDNLN
jgi:hypothetical protein